MRRDRRRNTSRGFTLLEVMMATSLLAVGAVSVLVVLATAAGYASQRQTQQRLTQVLEEARNQARTRVNAFTPAPGAKLPGGDDGKVDFAPSALFPGFEYALLFRQMDPEVPEAGYEVAVTVRYGDGQERAEDLVVASDVVRDKEFEKSFTYEQERAGEQPKGGPRETR